MGLPYYHTITVSTVHLSANVQVVDNIVIRHKHDK
jgi:hypothetical protein